MAELVHNRYTEEALPPNTLTPETVDEFFASGAQRDERWVRLFAPLMAFERALVLHMPAAIHELHGLQDEHGNSKGYAKWAENYGLSWRPRYRGEGREHRNGYSFWRKDWPDPDQQTKSFEFRPRGYTETPERYGRALETAFNIWKQDELRKEENYWNNVTKQSLLEVKQTYHAEWFVLYQFKGVTHSNIATWEVNRSGRPGIDGNTIAKGLASYARRNGISLRLPSTGGRPRST